MDGMLTQEEINALLDAIFIDGTEEKNISTDEMKTQFHRKETFDATIRALMGDKTIDDIVDITYMPEQTDIVDCPTCRKEFDICKAYKEDEKCPHCGQRFKIDLWIS